MLIVIVFCLSSMICKKRRATQNFAFDEFLPSLLTSSIVYGKSKAGRLFLSVQLISLVVEDEFSSQPCQPFSCCYWCCLFFVLIYLLHHCHFFPFSSSSLSFFFLLFSSLLTRRIYKQLLMCIWRTKRTRKTMDFSMRKTIMSTDQIDHWKKSDWINKHLNELGISKRNQKIERFSLWSTDFVRWWKVKKLINTFFFIKL